MEGSTKIINESLNKEKLSSKKITSKETETGLEETESNTSEAKRNSKETSPTSELLRRQKFLIQPSITDFAKLSYKPEDTREQRKHKSSDEDSDSDETEETIKPLEIDRKKIFTIIHSSLSEEIEQKNKENAEETNGDNNNKVLKTKNHASSNKEEDKNTAIKIIIKKRNLINEIESNDLNTELNKSKVSDDEKRKSKVEENSANSEKTKVSKSLSEQTVDSKLTCNEETTSTENSNNMMKIKISEVKSLLNKSPKHDMIKPRLSESPLRKNKERNADTNIIPVKASINQSGSSNKEFRSYSNIKNKKIAVSNNDEVKTSNSEALEKSKISESDNDLSSTTLKKRKISGDETSTGPSTKLVKLVPIESILNKGVKYINKMAEASSSLMNTTPSDVNVNCSEETLTETIKSEPDSDDDFQESENLEAKKR